MTDQTPQPKTADLRLAAIELLAATERRWEGETQRKRENAISPRMEEAMEALRSAIDTTPQPLSVGLDREAVARVERFLAEWAKGIHYGDLIYGLHTGTDREAQLTVTDLRAILALAAPADGWQGLLDDAKRRVRDCHECAGKGKVQRPHGFFMVDRTCEVCAPTKKAIAACLPAAPTGGRS